MAEPTLQEQYREIVEIGEDLLQVLETLPGNGPMDRLESLIQQRELAIGRAADLIARGERLQGGNAALEGLIVQQRVLEERLDRMLAEMRQTSAEAQHTRGDLSRMMQILRPTGASLVDKRR